MKVYLGLDDFSKIRNPVVTTGTFDGVHLGHKKIIARLIEIAAHSNGETVILTFSPHPRLVLFPEDNNLRLLSTMDEKTELLSETGIDHFIIYPFTKEFSRLSSTEYVRDILANRIGTKKLVIGYNHQFGRNREGSFENLKEYGHTYGFDVEEIPAFDVDSVKISSTKIRESLHIGDMKIASRYLGYDYMLTGKVVQNNQKGRSIGFPTANLVPPDEIKLIPRDGVYAVRVIHSGKKFNGMMNIGFNPTLNKNKHSLEVNIFDFNQDIYGRELKVVFIERLRDEIKFDNLNQLRKQLEEDKRRSLGILENTR